MTFVNFLRFRGYQALFSAADVGRGDLRARGVGKLSQSSGGGTWRSTTDCTGRWHAERRA